MADITAEIKIMPKDPDVDLNKLIENLKNLEARLHSSRIEPIGFGLSAVIATFVTEDAAGTMDAIEDALKALDGVGEIEILNVSRALG